MKFDQPEAKPRTTIDEHFSEREIVKQIMEGLARRMDEEKPVTYEEIQAEVLESAGSKVCDEILKGLPMGELDEVAKEELKNRLIKFRREIDQEERDKAAA